MAVDRKRLYHKRDRLRQLRAFCETVRYGSITQAAEGLGLSQPAVSLQVRELENELGAIMFERSGSGLTLTVAGQRLHDLAEPLVRGMDELSVQSLEQADHRGATQPRLRIATSPVGASLILPPHVKRLRDLYVGIRLRVKSCTVTEGMKLLVSGNVEFMLGPKSPSPEEKLDYREVTPYEIVLITSLDHPLAGRESVSPEEVSAEPAVVPPLGTYSRQFGEDLARRLGVKTNVVIEVGGWRAIKRYVELGLGVSIIPNIVITPNDRLSVVPLRGYFAPRSFGVFTRRAKTLTPPARKLLQLIVPESLEAPSSLHPSSRPSGGGHEC